MPSTRLAAALASLASPGARGSSFDTQAVRAAMEAHHGEARDCDAAQLSRQPGLHGKVVKVVVAFIVETPGVVTEAKVRQGHVGRPELEACLLAAVRRVTVRGWARKLATTVSPHVFQPPAPEDERPVCTAARAIAARLRADCGR